jgi:glycosyltransferase involved in cell wall biosynthesis
MKVLYAASMYPPAIGGSQVHMHHLAKTMKREGHGVEVATMTSRYRTDWLRMSTIACDPERAYEYEGIPVYQVGFDVATKCRMLPWVLGYYGLMTTSVRHISSVIAEKLDGNISRPSLVHATRVGREFLAHAACSRARKWGVPFLLTANHHPRWNSPLYREYTRLYRDADALFALTDHERQNLARLSGRSPESIHVTGVGPILSDSFSIEEFREKYNIRGPYVLYLGQQFAYKGALAMARAAETVLRRFPDIKVVFVGPHTPASRRYFRDVTEPRIVNTGQVDLAMKTAALAGCELLCLPSTQESFGGVFVEAWSFRKAVIGGRIPPIAELISEGEEGLLTSQSPSEIADKICTLLADQNARTRMGEAGWRKVQERYTWDKLAKRTEAVYRSLIA